MNTKYLRAFLYVVDEGSVAAAAERLHVSQPAVSRLIQLLEQQVGTKLFHRDQRNLVPTLEAELFYAEAQQIMQSVDTIPEFFAQLRQKSMIPLRLICQLRAAPGLVMPALAKFAKAHPMGGATLDIHPRQELSRRITKTKFDIGVMVLPLPGQNFDVLKRYRTRLSVLLPQDHPLTERPKLQVSDLRQETYISLREGLVARNVIDFELAKLGETLEGSLVVSSPASAHKLVADGVGFCFSDPVVLEPELREATRLVPFDLDAGLEIGVVVSKESREDHARDDFLEFLDEIWLAMSEKSAAA